MRSLRYSDGDWSRLTNGFAWIVCGVVYYQNTIINLVPSVLSVLIPCHRKQSNLLLSTKLKMQISHRKEFKS